METFLILLPDIAKARVVAWIKVITEITSANILRDDLLKVALDTEDENLNLINMEFGAIISGFSNMRAVLTAEGFESVPEISLMYNALNGGVEELYDQGEYYKHIIAANSVVRQRFGAAATEKSKSAANSWVSIIYSY